jgi:hypothetical protein
LEADGDACGVPKSRPQAVARFGASPAEPVPIF